MTRFLVILPCVLLLAGCGQTGPLYLPGQQPPKHGLSIKPDTNSPATERPTPIPLPSTVAKPVAPAAPRPPPPATASVATPASASNPGH